MKKIETIVLENLLFNEKFARKTLPFIKGEYFTDASERTVFLAIADFIGEFSSLPSKEAIGLVIKEKKNLTEEQFKKCREIVGGLANESQSEEWLIKETEKFCKEKSLYNAILESIHIIEGKSKDKSPSALPDILTKALSVSFDTNIGHDYIENADSRYDFYHTKLDRIPFDMELLNAITKGGVTPKTLNIILAGTGVGKSLFMCHHAAHCLSIGKNVLYITCEMAEERIAERIDANLLDTTIDDLQQFPKDVYKKKIERLREKTKGKLIIKEYPPCAAGANHFRILLEELRLKKNFKPDIIFIDYLNICASSRLKMNGTINSYLYVKAIAEELRGLAVEFSVPVFSATQVNRQGFGSSDFGLENTSESFGLPATADLMFALISTEELEALNQIQVKQLKNRYNSIVDNKRFVIGINRAKMKLFDVEASAQADIIQSEPGKPTEYKAFNRNGMQTRKFGDSDSKFKGWKL